MDQLIFCNYLGGRGDFGSPIAAHQSPSKDSTSRQFASGHCRLFAARPQRRAGDTANPAAQSGHGGDHLHHAGHNSLIHDLLRAGALGYLLKSDEWSATDRFICLLPMGGVGIVRRRGFRAG
jgi:hypothetical protein